MRRVLAFVRVAALAVAMLHLGAAAPASAVPPAGMALSSAAMTEARWMHHQVIPGDRLAQIARSYGVTVDRIVRWNRLDRDRPLIRVGEKLRIYSSERPAKRVRGRYRVRRGDSWSAIAKRFDVPMSLLRDRWNDDHGALRPGDRLVVFREVSREPEHEVPDEETLDEGRPEPGTLDAQQAAEPTSAVAIVDTSLGRVTTDVGDGSQVPQGAFSVGAPDRGRIDHAVQIPPQQSLYTLRKPEHSWGASHAIGQLQVAIDGFRQRSGYRRELVIMDMSRERGGRFRPHRSHQSGRDVDIRLPTREGLPRDAIPTHASMVDWPATWELVRSLAATGEVRFIFLSRIRQRSLYRAARRAGVSKAELSQLMQFPRRTRTALVRHARGHVKHLHVRFACAPDNTRCRD